MPFKKIITEDYWPAGLDAAKGANTKDGRFYWATDTGILYRDNGVDAWEPLGASQPGEPNGFEDRSNCTLTWDNPTRTLTLTGTYNVWSDGAKYTKTNDSFQISDTEGDHFIYYDAAGDLQELLAFDIPLISQFAFVAYVYWDATNSEAVPNAVNEQHGSSMTAATHEYLHRTQGTKYESGLALTMASVGGTGDLATDAQFSSAAGVIWDEDIKHTVLSRVNADLLPVIYKSGASGLWRMNDSASFPVITTGTGRAAYNQWTGATWQQTEVTNNDFVLAHIFAVPGVNETNGYLIAVQGEEEYATLGLAQAGAQTEITDLVLAGLPFQEFKEVGTIIFQTSDGFTNAVKSKAVSTDTGDDYVDWRLSDFSSAGVSSTSAAWGNISGTLSNQTDLQAALDAKGPAPLSGAGVPGVSTGDGYPTGTVYADTTADEGYVLTDNTTGANVWSTATGTGTGTAHAIGSATHLSDTLANFNSKLADATLDDIDDPRDADALLSATTTIDIASSAAPAAHEVLAATGPTAAAWKKTTLNGAGAPGVATGDGYPIGTVYADTTADEGYVLTDNSAGANVWSTATGAGGGGGSISVLDDAFEITAAVESFDFAGAGLTLSEPTANNVKLTVNGGEEVGGVLGAWKFSTADNAATDPGFGLFKANNTDTTLITEFYFSNGTAAGLALPMDEVFALGSKIVIQSMSDYSDAAYCEVTLFEAEPVVAEDWCRVTVTVLSSSGAGTWVNNRRHGVARLTASGAGSGASFAAITGVPEDNANISAFGASLIDDADAAAARATLEITGGAESTYHNVQGRVTINDSGTWRGCGLHQYKANHVWSNTFGTGADPAPAFYSIDGFLVPFDGTITELQFWTRAASASPTTMHLYKQTYVDGSTTAPTMSLIGSSISVATANTVREDHSTTFSTNNAVSQGDIICPYFLGTTTTSVDLLFSLTYKLVAS